MNDLESLNSSRDYGDCGVAIYESFCRRSGNEGVVTTYFANSEFRRLKKKLMKYSERTLRLLKQNRYLIQILAVKVISGDTLTGVCLISSLIGFGMIILKG